MKGLSHVVIGSITGGLLGAAAFFAIDGLIPSAAESDTLYRSPLHDNSLYGGPAYRGGGTTYHNVRDNSIHRNSLYDSQLRDRDGNTYNCNSLGSCSSGY